MEHGQLSVKQPGSVLYSGTLMSDNQDIARVGTLRNQMIQQSS